MLPQSVESPRLLELKAKLDEATKEELEKWPIPTNVKALDFIKECRKARNILAHFAVRRFPNDDAFLFITNSAKDYKRLADAKLDQPATDIGVKDGRIAAIAPQGRGFE